MPEIIRNLLRGTYQVIGCQAPERRNTDEHMLFGTRAMAGDAYRVGREYRNTVVKNRGQVEQLELSLHGK